MGHVPYLLSGGGGFDPLLIGDMSHKSRVVKLYIFIQLHSTSMCGSPSQIYDMGGRKKKLDFLWDMSPIRGGSTPELSLKS